MELNGFTILSIRTSFALDKGRRPFEVYENLHCGNIGVNVGIMLSLKGKIGYLYVSYAGVVLYHDECKIQFRF